ncbi:MAG: TIGR03560 family F420-dependent LLM class oxidoreductase [Acidimicrobiia bacterium]|nr:TIGR03560 family F420-dependent LLM class oxidoreductase [Acidimicrobiia bacterium]MDH4306977.1 TIGR03560 family F420-dependent LLM class oxidoreductase [Acidimicrobiia bacterium]MDH5294436.1 TIGR03560 family F420-dependent LLM class oxidoreductase [Acidimicrobiia bacterium]
MRHSFKVWAQETDWPTLRDCWVTADRQGFWDVVWLNDHLYPPKAPPELAIMEPWELFGGLAALTDRIRFGTMVSSNTFRHPSVLAKQAATLDQMSSGRLEIGLGAGWKQTEHDAFGIPLPPLTERFDRLEETLQILDGLFTSEVFSFDGRYTSIREARFEPKPVQRPRPPFVIGGAGPKRTIPIAARHADQWNYPDFDQDFAKLESALATFEAALMAIGRPRSDIELSVQFRYPDDLGRMLDLVATYEGYGADHILVSFSPGTDTAVVPVVAEALAERRTQS